MWMHGCVCCFFFGGVGAGDKGGADLSNLELSNMFQNKIEWLFLFHQQILTYTDLSSLMKRRNFYPLMLGKLMHALFWAADEGSIFLLHLFLSQ